MKDRKNWLIIPMLLGTLALQAQAEVSVRVDVGAPVERRYRGPAPERRNNDHRYYRRHSYRVVPAPVVVAPYYGGYPYAGYAPVSAPPPPGPVLSGDYGRDSADLNGRLARLRGVIKRQHDNDMISQDQYNRFMDTLEGIEQDEHARSFEHGGQLTSEDFADLFSRLDQAGEDIEVALAQ